MQFTKPTGEGLINRNYMKVIDNIFDIGDSVYLKTDSDQKERLVTRLMISGVNGISYELYAGSQGSWHYDFEISKEKNVLKTTSE